MPRKSSFFLSISAAAAIVSAAPIEQTPQVRSRAIEDPEVAFAQETLKYNAAAQDALAARIYESKLARVLSSSEKKEDALRELEQWVAKHPEDGAHLAVGFARDDRDGSHVFEDSLARRVSRLYTLSPNRYNGILGVLTVAGSESKSILTKLDVSDEERRELMKQFFEGTGAETSKVLTQSSQDNSSKGGQPPTAGAIFAGAGVYDRLNAKNITGYSPDILAIQSAFNAQRAPGEPKIPETGRLDYQTVAHPAAVLKNQQQKLLQDLKVQRAWALLQSAGRGAEDPRVIADDEAQLKELEARFSGKLGPRYDARRQALEQAARQLAVLEQQALTAKDGRRISLPLLRRLGSAQKEAARWLTIASLEADLERLAAHETFWTDTLRKEISSTHRSEDARRAYASQGLELAARINRIQNADQKALAALNSDDYAAQWPATDRLLRERSGDRKHLDEDIQLYGSVPFRLNSLWRPRARWRTYVEKTVKRMLPNTTIAKRWKKRDQELSAVQQAFDLIARGDFQKARAALN